MNQPSDLCAETIISPVMGYPLLSQEPDVNGGKTRVSSSGVSVYALWLLDRAGWSLPQILDHYTDLTSVEVNTALSYAKQHPDEMQAIQEADESGHEAFLNDYELPANLRKVLEDNQVLLRSCLKHM